MCMYIYINDFPTSDERMASCTTETNRRQTREPHHDNSARGFMLLSWMHPRLAMQATMLSILAACRKHSASHYMTSRSQRAAKMHFGSALHSRRLRVRCFFCMANAYSCVHRCVCVRRKSISLSLSPSIYGEIIDNMYMYMYAYIYIYTYVCMYVCIYLSIYLSISLSLSIYIYIYTHIIELERERERERERTRIPLLP